MDSKDLLAKINEISWYHSIDLRNGIITPGAAPNNETLKAIGLDNSLKDKTVLDIGAWDGLFSFEAERLGARRVVAADYYVWKMLQRKEGFSLAREVLNSKVEDKEIDVFDISPESVGVFDVVLFLGVLYHLKHPLLALEKVSSVTKEKLILETEVEFIGNRPMTFFYPTDEANNDSTNWWAPNPIAVKEMLKVVGFSRIEISFQTSIWSRFKEHAFNKNYKKIPIFDRWRRGRVVFQAWK